MHIVRKHSGSHHVDMLNKPLGREIFLFSLPLIASGILQQSFNVIDVAVIGRFSTSQAIAAVGSNGPIISILVNLFIGIAVGANVVIANYIGENKPENIRKSVNTVAVVSLLSGFLLMLIGTTLAYPILKAMNAPDDVIGLASRYLRIFFCGMPFMMIYNFGGAIMRSIGDTNKLFYSLFVATICNLVLDLLFVGVFGWGVEGAAWATVISVGVNAAIMVYYLACLPDPLTLDLNPSRWFVSMPDLKNMMRIGIPAGLQGMIFSISNIFIQSAINRFGAYAIAGSATALTFEVYCYYIISGFCGAAIAFTGQNYGAGNKERCRKVFRICMLYSLIFCGIANLSIAWHGERLLHIFTDDPEVIKFGLIRFRTVLVFQFLASSYEISGSYMRGLGYSVLPMIITIFGTCVLRLLWVYVFPEIDYSFGSLMSIYPISWIITGILVIAAAFRVQHIAFRAPNGLSPVSRLCP